MSRRGSLYRLAKRKGGGGMMKSLVKANEVTSGARTVRDLKSQSIADLRELFTGVDGSLLFVTTGDFVISKGITLLSETHPTDGMRASGWTHHIKTYAAKIGDDDNPDIVRKSYAGITIWNADWLEVHFPEIRRRAKEADEA